MKKFTAILLAALMIASAMPMSALAAELPDTEVKASSEEVKQLETTVVEETAVQETEEETVPEQTEAPTEAITVPSEKGEEPVGAKTDSKPLGASSFTYTVSNNKVTITGLTDNTITDLVIPDTIEEMTVVAIKESAFNGCSQITSITVPNSVTSIGLGAFKGTNPTNISLPFVGQNRSIYGQVYEKTFGYIFGYKTSCSDSEKDILTFQYRNGTSSYDTPYYFYIPKTIKEVVITDANRIPVNAFYNCSWIENITINDGVEEIKSNAFYNCSSLKEIITPESVNSIGSAAFYNCSSLAKATISNNVSKLSENLFYGCTSLETVNFPDSLKTIESNAFYNCTSFNTTDLEIPNGVLTIGDYAFYNCKNITSITVPNSVTSIGKGTFKGTNPVEVTLPFVGSNRSNSGYTYDNTFGVVFGYKTSCSDSEKDILTFQYRNGTSSYDTPYYFYIPKTIKEVVITDANRIPVNAFYNCSWIENITINDGVEEIKSNAFYNCSSLKEIITPESVNSIGSAAFYNCSSLAKATISNNVSKLSENLFYGCTSLETVNFPDSLKTIESNAFYNCTSFNTTDLEIPNGVLTIGDYAFYNCKNITSITVPNSVTSIGKGTFKGTNPVEVTLPFVGSNRSNSGYTYDNTFGVVFGYKTSCSDSEKDILTFQYRNGTSSYDTPYYFYIPKTIKEVVITDANRIPVNAFYNCSWIENITINDGVEEIKSNAFYNCSSLKEIITPESVNSIGSAAFYNCSSLAKATISNNVSKLSENLFYGCTSLETVNFPDSLKTIESNAFYNCTSFNTADLEIPNGVLTIGDYAFYNCKNITSITVPNSVTSIGKGTFKGTNPVEVTLPFVGSNRSNSGYTYDNTFGVVFGYKTSCSDSEKDILTFQYRNGTSSYDTPYYFYIPKTIKEVVITDANRIPVNAFYNCSWIEKVYINDVEGDESKVGNNAFYNCKAMTVYINRDTAVHTYCERNGIKHCSTKSITLENDSLVLFRNGTGTIGSEVILLNDKVDDAPETVWTSSNPEVATVDRNTGVISAVAPGTATITADSEGVTATAEVTVYFQLEGISLNKNETQIDIGKTETLTVIYDPDNTTDSKDVTWKSSNNTVATVDENGTVTAVKRGKATITATGANGVTATCEVQVLVPITEIKFESEAVSIPRSTRQKVPFTISPADYTDTYTVTSSDTEIATVDKFGNVVARKVGTAVITVKTSRGLEANCVVTVYSPATSINLSADSKTIFANRSFDLTAELSPSDCTDKVTWSSSDDSIAEVDSSGKVTGISKGVATITATADSGITADCVVTVESDINNTTIYLEYNETDYDGEDKTPEVYVYFDDERLVEETDYLLYYYDNLNAGDAGVIITSLYDGTEVTKTFKINPLTVTALDITCKSTMTYTGSELKGVENITYKSLRLAEGVDYDIRYENNVNVGKATATITGKGNFTGPTTRTFTIVQKPISETTITLDNNTFRYDGKRKTPTVTVRDGAKTLELGKDYNVEYTDNINAGEATVTVTGIGNYGSYAEKKFNIEKRSISDATVVLSPDKFLDNGDGKARCPQVTVTDGDRELEQDVDYTVAYDNNIEAGIGTVVITAKGNYSSSTSANFEICLTGDINNDGRVDVLDATAVQKFSVDKVEFSDYQKFVADVNHDGVVDILDASQIQKYAVDKISSF